MRAAWTMAALTSLAVPSAAIAAPEIDLSQLRCTRLDTGASLTGDALAKQGFAITAKDRFNNVNVMMFNAAESVHANCFVEREGKK